MARVKAETDGKILQERKNHDLTVEKKIIEAKEYRDTVLQSISLAGTTIGNGLKEFLGDKERLVNVAGTVSMVALGVYSAKVGTGIFGTYLARVLGKPSLVRETSKSNVLGMMRNPKEAFTRSFGSSTGEAALKDVILEKNLSDRLKRVAISTSNTKKNRAPFRHLLLHGPPGTGKTMFAKGLARESGLHYAIMTGGDVAPLGKDAVTEIHKMFDWANSTNKGILLFIDEVPKIVSTTSFVNKLKNFSVATKCIDNV